MEAMRIGVLVRTGRWLSGPGKHRWSPQALMVMMASGAFAPLLVAGNTDSALLVTGMAGASVGANVITEILQGGVDHLREHDPSLGEVEEWLTERFEEVLEAGGRRADVLQGQLALVFDEICASQTALRSAIETGDRKLQTELAAGLTRLEESFDDVGIALAQAHLKLDRIHRDLGAIQQASAIAGRCPTSNTFSGTDVNNVMQIGTVHGAITIGASSGSHPAPPRPVGIPLAQLGDPFALEVHRPVELEHAHEDLVQRRVNPAGVIMRF